MLYTIACNTYRKLHLNQYFENHKSTMQSVRLALNNILQIPPLTKKAAQIGSSVYLK